MHILDGQSLTPFEWTMSNEFSDSVMEFTFRLRGIGEIEVESFNAAIVNALKQQPLRPQPDFRPTRRCQTVAVTR